LDDGEPAVPSTVSAGDAGAAPGPGVPAGAAALPPIDVVELEVDIVRDAERGWGAAAVHFPEPLRLAVAAKLGAGSVPPVIAGAAEDAQDPLKIAGHFLRAVLKQDFAVARGVTDTEQVTREKVAGLCILFEEGAYTIAEHRPLSATAAGSDAAWVIVKVKSGRDGHESDFGLELRRLASGAWQVAGVNFSKMLASYAASAGVTEGVAYTPIVKNPSGGESLVVYFDFNDAGLVPRARRQLEIVANLLRDDPRRKLRLSGHADAIGSDTYNRRLSAARALVVKDTLASFGVSPEQIVTEGLGTLRPLDPNTKPDGSDNPEGRSRNRRTEIFLDF
jgi:outer membrane protein OmpA-like peptidoglycan-associated protein